MAIKQLDFNKIDKDNFSLFIENFSELLFQINMYSFYDKQIDTDEVKIYVDYDEVEEEIASLYQMRILGEDVSQLHKTILERLNFNFEQVFKCSFENDLYFNLCSAKSFKNTFEKRFKEYRIELIDVEQNDFVKVEYKRILNIYMHYENKPHWNDKITQLINNSKVKKLEYLENLLQRTGYEVKVEHIKNDHFESEYHWVDFQKIGELVKDNYPLEDHKIKSSAIEKIIYLNELGIIEFLRKNQCFASSTNNLAKVVSSITGENRTTVQPYLNALLSSTLAENKNPANSKATTEKVKTNLMALGFKPK